MNTQLIETKEEKQNQLVITKSLICQADNLAEEHERFNANYIVAGRLALYGLLAKIYSLYRQLEATPDKKSLLEDMRFKLAKTYQIRTQANTSDLGLLVRYITRADRKTTHVYSRAIETAMKNEIGLDEFVDYIQNQGGIEQMRAFGVDGNFKRLQDKDENENLEIAKQHLLAMAEKPLAEIELNQNMNIFGQGCFYDYFVGVSAGGKKYRIIGKINADKDFEAKVLKSFADMIDLDDPDIKKKVLTQIELAKQRREKRWAENEARPYSERHLIRGEFPEVRDELFNEIFE
uniref:hypothetical protein n=1 Tax=Polynucleobacter sp. TaxID=2029855 RepID=UPI0040478FE4